MLKQVQHDILNILADSDTFETQKKRSFIPAQNPLLLQHEV